MSISMDGESDSPSASSTTEVINQLVKTAKERRQTIENLQSEISDIRDELATRAKRNAKHRKRISEQEDRISELEDKTDNTDSSQSSEKQASTDRGNGKWVRQSIHGDGVRTGVCTS
jgi:Cobalamin adenosyltransferase.